ncbi:amino acid carrier protein [Hominifimenecus microfluidus]|uniref:alanine/glycine:cation symporter family protein n=1 Tax=Hominifimenecus microfluidus TaxID=2885348 RepID=UPI0032C0A89A
MLFAFLLTGFYFTVATRFFQIRYFSLWIRQTLFSGSKPEGTDKEPENSMTRFQALCTSLAATIGTGNIAGVAAAIVAGGPGSLFWMWISAFFGMMTSYAEKLLGHCYRRRREDGSYCGGAMMTMEFGLGSRPMGMLYALLCLPVSFGMGNMVQVNAIAQSAEASLRISPLFTAAVLIPALIFCLKQNSTGIGRLNAVLVPVMSVVYMTGAFLILWIGRRQLPAALDLVRDDIFSWRAISVGVARGVFSNEAGLGTSVIAHAQSDVTEPAEQGMWGILEVFLDTIVMCTVTGLVLLVTGICGTSHDGAVLTMDAFASVFGPFGRHLISLSILLFAFSTLVGWSFFGMECVRYIDSPWLSRIYPVIYIAMILPGCFWPMQTVWRLSDLCNALLAIPNLLSLFLLRKQVIYLTNLYLDSKL